MAAITTSRPNPASQTQISSMRGSQTQTITPTTPAGTRTQPVLRLRGEDVAEGTSSRRRIQWADDVVDNEGLGRKKSKVCCIYHPPRAIDESSDESSDNSSDSDSDSEPDNSSARPAKKSGVAGRGAGGKKDCGHGHDHSKDKGKGRARSPNAYEKQPLPKPKGPDGGAQQV